MKQFVTKGIVMQRTNFGEADRILTVLTPEYGKIRLIAKGVRKSKSKLAGGVELFSVSDVSFIRGRGDIGTLISARLDRHYSAIVQDIDRTMLGYELIKRLHKVTEDEPGSEYFDLLVQAFEALDNHTISLLLIQAWFNAQLLMVAGHTPNLRTDTSGKQLTSDKQYHFNMDDMAFNTQERGSFSADTIKILRLLFSAHQPVVISKILGVDQFVEEIHPLIGAMVRQHLHIRV